jgi:hypothetical protein
VTPPGFRHSMESRNRMRQAHIRRCADPTIKAVWSKTERAINHWYGDTRIRRPSPLGFTQGDTR